jgi:hypothetical protein
VTISAQPDGALRSVLQRGGFADVHATDPARWISREAVA